MAGRKRVSKTPLSQRLTAAGERVGLEAIAFGTDTKMRTLEGYLRGDTIPDAEFLQKFVRITGIDPVELLMGEPTTAANGDYQLVIGGNAALVDRLELQVSAGAGAISSALPVEPVPFSLHSLRNHNLRAAELAVLQVRGDSMQPVLDDGDSILVDKARSKPVSGKMHVVVRGDSVQVKWVLATRTGITLVSENPDYPPERIDPVDAPDFYRVRWLGHFLE